MPLLRPLLMLLLIGVIVLPIARPVQAATDTYVDLLAGPIQFHPFTIDAPSGGCPVWRDTDGTTRNCDPVNLIFPGKTWQQVQDALVARGWTLLGIGSPQSMHFGDNSQRFLQDAHIYYWDGPDWQYHVRLWQVRGTASAVTIGAVHHEQRVDMSHIIDLAWEDAEAFLAGQFCLGRRVSCSTTAVLTQQAVMQAQNLDRDNNRETWRGWANNKQATIIRLGVQPRGRAAAWLWDVLTGGRLAVPYPCDAATPAAPLGRAGASPCSSTAPGMAPSDRGRR